jgi:hypothetical protein
MVVRRPQVTLYHGKGVESGELSTVHMLSWFLVLI